jgi:hypothetical protein
VALKYLCLIYFDEEDAAVLPCSDLDILAEECHEYTEELKASGRFVASAALQPVRTAMTVRPRNGRVAVDDGPFAEMKEQLSGFYLIEARDLNEAIQVASRIPPGRLGAVEVRPIVEGEEGIAWT